MTLPLLSCLKVNATVQMSRVLGDRLECLDATDLNVLASLCNVWIASLNSRKIRPNTPLSSVRTLIGLKTFESDIAAQDLEWVIGLVDATLAEAGNDPWGDGVRLVSILAVVCPCYAAEVMEVRLEPELV